MLQNLSIAGERLGTLLGHQFMILALNPGLGITGSADVVAQELLPDVAGCHLVASGNSCVASYPAQAGVLTESATWQEDPYGGCGEQEAISRLLLWVWKTHESETGLECPLDLVAP
eukprot:597139-Amphidinium_carterae.2